MDIRKEKPAHARAGKSLGVPHGPGRRNGSGGPRAAHRESDPFLEAPCAESRLDMIATAAYYLAERRGFAPGRELDDWLEAESSLGRDGQGPPLNLRHARGARVAR